MSIIGSELAMFSRLELSTADDKHYTLNMTPVSRLAFRLIGIPHLGFRGRARHIIRESIAVARPDFHILDAGCGYGIYSLNLSMRQLGSIDSIDLDPARIEALKQMTKEQPEAMGRMKLHVGSVTSLPFRDAGHDLVICSEVIEHVADDGTATRELSRVLKPGGTLILSVPFPSRHNQKIFHRFGHERPGYSREDLAKIFTPLGISIKKDFYYEYALGTVLFEVFNKIKSRPLMGLLFYPFYTLYRLDALLRIGQPNGIVIVATKN